MKALSGYQIIDRLYESGSTNVYRAIHTQSTQLVILKILEKEYPTPQERTCYKQEYEISRHLNLDGIAKAISFAEKRRTSAIIFEDFGGESLRKSLRDRVTLSEFLPIAIQIAEILGQIHTANVIHKDINPGNILLHPETGKIKIIDFGISTTFSRENLTLQNSQVLEGTLAYISPEQTGRMNRFLDYRTDFYSLGVTFYELLVGHLPFLANDALELVHCHIAKHPTPPHQIYPDIPQSISEIVMTLMAKTAEDRYQSAWGLKADLEACLEQLSSTGAIAPFPLGTQDNHSRFQIPQKLYGRDSEIQTLLAAFERVSARETSSAELMLVVGYSGIGKSALVQELYKPITRDRGYFIAGKFEQFQRNIPYFAIVSAFSSLARQLLTETETQLQQWRDKLLAILGNNGQVIIDLIPEVELIIGKQPPVPELGATETQNRFNLVFQNFIQVFCHPEHPLVLFLDDLQWADSASLKLIQLMMTDLDTRYLLLIGAYRDNEVDLTHPLTLTLDKILQYKEEIVNQITLTPLSLEHLERLIADTLNDTSDAVKPLAKLVLRKTGGNPFFASEFLKTLYEEKLLNFDSISLVSEEKNQGRWQWNLARIEELNITENIVDLLVVKIKKLSPSVQRVLQIAACLGTEFDLNTLSLVCARSETELFEDIKQAIQVELIIALSSLNEQLVIQNYKFAHDRIQQAAYSSIEELEKKEIHLKIGRLLLQNTSSETLSENIFEIVDHLNMGIELVTWSEERDEIAKLNAIAGHKARTSMAYRAATYYFNVGIALLPSDSWITQYDLALDLHESAVAAEYLNSNFEQAEQLANIVLQKAKTVLDKFKVYETKIQFYCVQNQMQLAIATGLQVLEMLKVSLSESPPADLQIKSLDKLPEMTNPSLLSAMRIFINLFSPAYISNPSLLPTIAFTMLKLCHQEGNSAQAAFAYAFYGVLLCTAMNDPELGYKFGTLAIKTLGKFESRDIKCKVHEVFNAFIRHWKEPASESLEPLRETVQFGLEVGDVEFSGYSAIHYCAYVVLAGEQLESAHKKQIVYLKLLQRNKQEFSLYYARVWMQFACNLMGSVDNPTELSGEFFDEAKILQVLKKINNLSSLFCVNLVKAILCYLFKKNAEAVDYAQNAVQYEPAMAGLLPAVQLPFYYSLSLLSLYLTVDSKIQTDYLDIINLNQERTKKWVDCCPVNFKHKYDLVEAEKARVLGENWKAAELYDRAIQGAKNNGYLQEEALAYELAAEFYLDRGMETLAKTHLKEARDRYRHWQAWAKVKDLETRYARLFVQLLNTESSPVIQTTKTQIQTITGSKEELDLASVIKASQAIGSEILIETLLQKLIKTLAENAGAQTAFLLLEKKDRLFIEAQYIIESEKTKVLPSTPIEQELPTTIINYVTRTKESVVLNNATEEGNFTNDPYIQEHQTRSVLCTPLVNQGKLVSIVYLENNLTPGAFTRDRVEVVKILSSQAAISLENALLYRTLEERVKERTAQLAEANEEITLLNERLKEDNLRMGAELDIAKQLQQMVLPKTEELEAIEGLEIAGFMEPADEVGGDYYDVLKQDNGVKIAIGDVTGHGLESGVLMIMAQTAVRTLQKSGETDPVKFFEVINQTLYENLQRMDSYKNMTLAMVDYSEGTLSLSGQHEELIIVRSEGEIERIDTIDLGFPIGLDEGIADFIAQERIQLNVGDVAVLYTDGITEAENPESAQYRLERLCQVIQASRHQSAAEIRTRIVEDVRNYIGEQKVFDDITLVVMKQK
ncbi:AAA family ATPase [Lusitaniella coriacea LEGE 07157]|uniref:AAA family ATPase n=1 Tax=Lusitaniella coriacea LEGE 07157 TaxID=945747 RepID=A0A8J7E0E7_9CYAN|nr:AAA family ATPase [Lusitaniella coriacea]MBE9118730.1 AAA family ATPase [Lusitaniella coriacea LEGE 07157]